MWNNHSPRTENAFMNKLNFFATNRTLPPADSSSSSSYKGKTKIQAMEKKEESTRPRTRSKRFFSRAPRVASTIQSFNKPTAEKDKLSARHPWKRKSLGFLLVMLARVRKRNLLVQRSGFIWRRGNFNGMLGACHLMRLKKKKVKIFDHFF